MEIKKTVDCKGLSCPEPILHTKMAVKNVAVGEHIEVLATDPGSINDMDAWSKRTGNPIMESSEEGGVYRFVIKRGK